MQAIILAGGFGTRLRPLTYTVPKPMLPVANRPAILHTVDALAQAGCREVIITTNFLAHIIDAALETLKTPIPVRCVREAVPLGTAGCVLNILDELDEKFLVIQGDAVAEIDYAAMMRAHREREADVTMSVMHVEDTREFGIVATDAAGRIERFQEKPRAEDAFSHLANTGFYALNRRIFDGFARGQVVDFSLDLFPRVLARNGFLFAWPITGSWIDIGQVPAYIEGNRRKMAGHAEVAPGVAVPASATLLPPFLIGPGVTLGEECVVGPNTVVAENCVLQRGVSAVGSVLYDNVEVGEYSRLSDCVVASQAKIGANAIIEPMAVVGQECEIGDGAHLKAHSRVGPVTKIAPKTTVDGVVSPHLEQVELTRRAMQNKPEFADFTPEQQRVFALLTEFGEMTARGLAETAQIPFSRVHAVLYPLETKNIILSTPDMPRRYALTRGR
jgi:NDP-sugar pyrophosphorylase family protein